MSHEHTPSHSSDGDHKDEAKGSKKKEPASMGRSEKKFSLLPDQEGEKKDQAEKSNPLDGAAKAKLNDPTDDEKYTTEQNEEEYTSEEDGYSSVQNKTGNNFNKNDKAEINNTDGN